jgi:hypothetical protein
MRRTRDLLRLKYAQEMSDRAVTVSLGFSSTRVPTGFDNGIISGNSGNDLSNNYYVEPIANGSGKIINGDTPLGTLTSNDDHVQAGAGDDYITAGPGPGTVSPQASALDKGRRIDGNIP